MRKARARPAEVLVREASSTAVSAELDNGGQFFAGLSCCRNCQPRLDRIARVPAEGHVEDAVSLHHQIGDLFDLNGPRIERILFKSRRPKYIEVCGLETIGAISFQLVPVKVEEGRHVYSRVCNPP